MLEDGQIVKWNGETNASNVVRQNDIAVCLNADNRKFLGVTGSIKGQIFYESCTNYSQLTTNEERDLFFTMRMEGR
jgi:hypothetical protein